jgi:hypothetical protein
MDVEVVATRMKRNSNEMQNIHYLPTLKYRPKTPSGTFCSILLQRIFNLDWNLSLKYFERKKKSFDMVKGAISRLRDMGY